MAKRTIDQLVTELGPFEVELIGKTLRIIGSDGGDVLVVGNVQAPGARPLANLLAGILNEAMIWTKADKPSLVADGVLSAMQGLRVSGG